MAGARRTTLFSSPTVGGIGTGSVVDCRIGGKSCKPGKQVPHVLTCTGRFPNRANRFRVVEDEISVAAFARVDRPVAAHVAGNSLLACRESSWE